METPMNHHKSKSQVKMMFDWRLQFNWLDDGSDLVPCMSGGLFAITQPGRGISGDVAAI